MHGCCSQRLDIVELLDIDIRYCYCYYSRRTATVDMKHHCRALSAYSFNSALPSSDKPFHHVRHLGFRGIFSSANWMSDGHFLNIKCLIIFCHGYSVHGSFIVLQTQVSQQLFFGVFFALLLRLNMVNLWMNFKVDDLQLEGHICNSATTSLDPGHRCLYLLQ